MNATFKCMYTLCVLLILLATNINGLPAEILQNSGVVLHVSKSNVMGSPETLQIIQKIAEDINPQWLQFNIYFRQDNVTSSFVFNSPDKTPTDEAFITGVTTAINAGMKVMIKILMSVRDSDVFGGINLNPLDPDQWFESYTSNLLHFAQLSEQYGVSALAVATELPIMTAKYPDRWSKLISQVREEYSGIVTYASLIIEFFKIPFWQELDWIGIDAYFPLNSTSDVTPSLNEMTDRATFFYGRVQARLHGMNLANKTVIFTESGVPSYTGSIATPWLDFEDCSTVQSNNTAQASAFQAVFTAIARANFINGIFVYHVDLPKNQDYVGTSGWSCGFTFRNKPAYKIIASEFNSNGINNRLADLSRL
jgi:hypothetical protein